MRVLDTCERARGRRERKRRPTPPLRLSALLAAVVACVWLWSAGIGIGAADGAVGHGFLSSFGSSQGFIEPDALAVDQADGQVLVGDAASGVVSVFSSSGTLLTSFGGGEVDALGLAVDEATGDVYVANSFENTVSVFAPDGKGGYERIAQWSGSNAPGESFGEVTGVAVDNSAGPNAGEVYVVDDEDQQLGEGVVDVFKPADDGGEGELVRVIGAGDLEEPNGVALSKISGAVFVADSPKGVIEKFSPTGALEAKWTGSGSPQGKFKGPEEEEGNVAAIGLDESSGDVLVAEAERDVLGELNSSGEWVGWITGTPQGAFGEPRGVGVSSDGQVYVADAGREQIDEFGQGELVPDVITGKASKIMRTTAILGGTVNGDGKPSKYRFQWGSTPELGRETSTTAAGTGEEAVNTTLSGLHPSSAYFYRIVGENEDGTNVGIVRELETPTAVEGVSTGEVAGLEPNEATLTGALKPNGLDTHYDFEWGTTTSYGSQTAITDAGSGSQSVKAEAKLQSLKQNTTYHYRIYAENELGITRGEDRHFTTPGQPRLTIEAPAGVGHYEATLNAKIDPDERATSYRFQYGPTTAYGSEAPVGGGSIPAGEAQVPVSATLSGLSIGKTYHYRLIASNGIGEAVASPDQTLATIAPAPVDALYAGSVTASSAVLHAQIDPLGNDTHFYFQYGTESCEANPSACSDVPAPPGADIGSATSDQAEEQTLAGLQANTTYFYRAIASNSLGTTEEPERSFRTRPEEPAGSASLPDHRAWEMVTPPQKDAPVEALTREGGVIEAAEDGNSLTYVTDGSVGEGAQGDRTPEVQQIIATRTPEKWVSQDVATPSTEAKGVTAGQIPEYQYFTPDLSTALVEPPGKQPAPPLAPGVSEDTIYLRDNSTGTFLPLVTEADVAPGTKFGLQVHFEGASTDLSHVVIGSKVGLLGAGSTQGLYEWAQGRLQQISILPSGLPASGLVQLGYNHITASAISEDGSRIEWTNSLSEGIGPLYARDTTRQETVRLDVPQGTGEQPSFGEARFQAASSDGSKVFFTDWQRLTPSSTAERTAKEPDLYECEMVVQNGALACLLSDLTAPQNSEEHANVKGDLLAVNAQGSEIMLVAQDILATNENGNHETAETGANNLYELRNEDGTWTYTFIARLSNEDSVEWENSNNGNTAYLTARLSPNGRYFAFMSAAPITGYDNTDLTSGKPDEEVFLYDTADQSLRCVSCNPTGSRPQGVFDTLVSGEGLGLVVDRRRVWSPEGDQHWLAGNIPGWTAESVNSAIIQPRYLTDQGRLFFNSPDTLVPQATNGKEDVYEYEPTGVGTCQSESGGCIALLSSGTSEKESAFLEATPDGSNVFFITAQQLLPQDTDTAFDIYDARECTTQSPCQQSPEREAAPCGSEADCRPAAPASQAPLGPAGSATASAASPAPLPASPPKQAAKGVKSASKPPTRAQQLAKALRVCRKERDKHKRRTCERHARKLFGPRAKKRAHAKNHRTPAEREVRP